MGKPHEIFNKELLADLIAEAMANVVLKVNNLSYNLWYYYELEATPYSYCTTKTLDILSDMGAPAQEVDIFVAEFPFELSWDPGNVGDNKIAFAAGTHVTLNKWVEQLHIHFQGTTGKMQIITEGHVKYDC